MLPGDPTPPPLPGRHAAPDLSAPSPAPLARRPARATTIVLSTLLVLAIGGIAVLSAFLLRTNVALDQATDLLEEQQQRIERQEVLLEQQSERLDEKETFGAAMQRLMETVRELDGVPMGELVDFPRIQELASGAWESRHHPAAVREHTDAVTAMQADLTARHEAAMARRALGAARTADEVIQSLGRGFVETVWGDAGAVCQSEAVGCVWGGDPYVIHLDADAFAQPYRTAWGESLVAHHEFAHVLQFTNPQATDAALGAFGGDREFMADCYALTALDSWTLDERVWQGSSAYWDVSYGYGAVCDDAQRSAIGSWLAGTGVQYRPITQ